jgi:hypothetical protein
VVLLLLLEEEEEEESREEAKVMRATIYRNMKRRSAARAGRSGGRAMLVRSRGGVWCVV